jgi:hypothetical protein
MRRIGDASFFRIADRLLAPRASRDQAVEWVIDGVRWQRERHSYSGATHSFTAEVTTGRNTQAPPWTLLIVKEYWRKGEGGDDIKSLQWAHVTAGRRTDVVAWLKRQERSLDR